MKTPAAWLRRTLIGSVAVASFPLTANGQGYYHRYTPPFPTDSAAAIQQGTLGAAWATSRDLGSRLYRHRAGIRPGMHLVEQPAPPVTDSKGGMASSKGAKVAAIAAPVPNRWEVFGSLFYFSEDSDRWRYDKCGDKLSADSSLDTWGGSVGVEYHINSCWSAGLAVSGAQSDLDQGSRLSVDIDSVMVSPYITYYRQDVLGSADLWADLTYSYGHHSYDIKRSTFFGNAKGSPDGDTHMVEFQTGLNYGENDIIHGPFAGVRWITGSVDSYDEDGGGDVPEMDVDSLVSILGYQVTYRARQGAGYWVPQLRASWEHEFEDVDSISSGGFSSSVDSGDEDFAVIGAGIGYYWDNGWNLLLEYEGRFSGDTEANFGKLSAGKEF